MLVTHGQVLLGGSTGGFAVLDAHTARSLPWPKNLIQKGNAGTGYGSAYAFASSGDTIYLGATSSAPFNRAGGRPANNLASVVLPSGKFTNWRPDSGRCTSVGEIAVSGREILAGGRFSDTPCD